ncbi:MAG: 30S ribosomal protein S18 [Chloroflexi bacterium]|nr:30S ribosomal protein S18 [Chloroflexota bacterium]
MTTRGRAAPRRREGRPRFYTRRRVCAFCVDKVRVIDYKDVGRLRRYLSDRVKIESRRKSGTCSKHQRGLALALKRARHLAMLPFTHEHMFPLGTVRPPAPAPQRVGEKGGVQRGAAPEPALSQSPRAEGEGEVEGAGV